MNPHLQSPSPWVLRWASKLRPGSTVLDLACGHGRHAKLFAGQGHTVLALDRDADALAQLAGLKGVETLCADIETERWPLGGRQFDAVIVVNYLHRPLWRSLVDTVAPGGMLIYETFMQGNERYGRPSNPDFLLRPAELLEATRPLEPVAFEQGVVESRAVVQRICAFKGLAGEFEMPA
ncbi:MAG TPA: class I SAM-dependent methyltransferase [Burkholderiales bacterium]|nr:class I SAM-dependent methyltransferase [Burkholderiales bacterium]